MDNAGRKLQYKENFDCLIINNPDECTWSFPFDESRTKKIYDLEVIFIRSQAGLQEFLSDLSTHYDDRLRWIAYPKKNGSVPSDLSRDIIWEDLKAVSFQPVAMVSLTNNWSAMRVRHNGFVKKLVRENTAMPEDLRNLLVNNPECNDFFNTLSNTNKKEYIGWINSAKREKTRMQRLEKTKTLLQDKVLNPFADR